MWGKPTDASTEKTGDWFAVPLSRSEEGPMAVVGPFASESEAWDWLEGCVRERDEADGGQVFDTTAPDHFP